jgi:hypothetical protein
MKVLDGGARPVDMERGRSMEREVRRGVTFTLHDGARRAGSRSLARFPPSGGCNRWQLRTDFGTW